jgi:lysophospholipase L1-like esterase
VLPAAQHDRQLDRHCTGAYTTPMPTAPTTILSLLLAGALCAAPGLCAQAAELEAKPADAAFSKFEPAKAPAPGGLLLRKGDQLAIIGDSITEQKQYSRMIETYLTVCVPELGVTARQYGWSGETAEGFLHRMDQDCLRFKPTVATLCYGMNDYKYRPYDEANAHWYRDNYRAVVRKLEAAGARVVVGSAGCVGKVASWVKSASGTLEEHNLNLCALRNIALEIALAEHARFADNFWPMLTLGFSARQRYGAGYNISGQDGVHPGGAGHLVMAYDYLHAMGLDGAIGTITVDLGAGTASASDGHHVDGFSDGVLHLTSTRYPFCATGAADQDGSLRSGMTLVPFNQELNRLVLVVRGGSAAKYQVTWGEQSRSYTAAELGTGVNLADDFPQNPFSGAFARVDAAVAAKQAYETRQIKEVFHGPEGKAGIEAAAVRTEAALVPVVHAIRITAQ